jgi:hypothetical protein
MRSTDPRSLENIRGLPEPPAHVVKAAKRFARKAKAARRRGDAAAAARYLGRATKAGRVA